MTAPMVRVPVELAQCPFCDGARTQVTHVRDGLRVSCGHCLAEGPPTFFGPEDRSVTRNAAITAWNRTAAPAPPQAVQGEHCPACKMPKNGHSPILSCACATLVMHPTPAMPIAASGDVERHLKVLREMRDCAELLDDEEAAALDAAIAALRSQGQAVAVELVEWRDVPIATDEQHGGSEA